MADRKNDYGERVMNSRKELWDYRNMQIDWDDSASMRKVKEFQRNTIWKLTPKDQRRIADECGKEVAYFVKKIHDFIPARFGAVVNPDEDLRTGFERYASFVETMRDAAMKIRDEEGIYGFRAIIDWYVRKTPYETLTNIAGYEKYPVVKMHYQLSVLRDGSNPFLESMESLKKEMERKGFLSDKREKRLAKALIFHSSEIEKALYEPQFGCTKVYLKKEGWKWLRTQGKFVPTPGYSVFRRRDGGIVTVETGLATRKEAEDAYLAPDSDGIIELPLEKVIRKSDVEWRRGDVSADDFMEKFGFRGVNFGSTVPKAERQKFLNEGYDSMMDMCRALHLEARDMSLGGRIAISFGGRGVGGAAAHYEPFFMVINLTRKKGAGAFAHEWGHALDHYVHDTLFGTGGGIAASESGTGFIREAVDEMRYTDVLAGIPTAFHASSLDHDYGRKPYWSLRREEMQRAMACAVKDAVEESGVVSNWTYGHAENQSHRGAPVYPTGKERIRSTELMLGIIEKCKTLGLLHDMTYAREPAEKKSTKERFLIQEPVEHGEQMTIFDILPPQKDERGR